MFRTRLTCVMVILLSILSQTNEISVPFFEPMSSTSISHSRLDKQDSNFWPPSWWTQFWEGFNPRDAQNSYSNSASANNPGDSNSYKSNSGSHNQPSTSHWSSWWTWSSKDGYRSGKGDAPSNAYFSNSNSNSESGGYGPPSPSQQHNFRHYEGPHIPTKGSEIQQWLHHYNRFRARYGAKALTWSPQMVASSKRLTETCVWEHTQNNPFGENMSAGQTSIQEVVEGWVGGPEEKDSYRGSSNSEPSHFTQVVWLSTTEVGCYRTTCQDVRGANLPQSPVIFWACNYNPPGNVIGEFKQNVEAQPGGNPI